MKNSIRAFAIIGAVLFGFAQKSHAIPSCTMGGYSGAAPFFNCSGFTGICNGGAFELVVNILAGECNYTCALAVGRPTHSVNATKQKAPESLIKQLPPDVKRKIDDAIREGQKKS